MLIRVRGGDAGIKEYLENGQKEGRDYHRDELDERVILSGDLDLTDTIIRGMDKEGQNYFHFTLAFKENNISKETLKEITEEFKKFAMSAYSEDEFNFYAEAHLPRVKSYTNQATGEFVERMPHIHALLPANNLLTGKNLNPFGRVEHQIKFIDAFQEHINAKFGLASPKDNRRIEFTDESAIISRYKGDYFKGANHDLKERILSDVLDKGVTDFDQFRAIVAEHGDTKTRNAGKAGEYLNVKPEGAAKGVNLKEYVFSREFIEMPAAEKRQKLAGEIRAGYEEAQAPRPTPADIAARLKEWHEVRAAEVKYLNSGNRKAYAAYKAADPEQRRAILAERAATFYAKHRPAVEVPHDPEQEQPAPARAPEQARASEATPAPSRERDGRQTDSVVGQYEAEHRERAARGTDSSRAEFNTIKRDLDAARLLASVSRTHGVMPDKYEVTKGKDGGDRIRCGSRNLNVSDFLTQELHLPWRDAAPILQQTYAAQIGHAAPQQARPALRRDLWADYRKEWQPQQRERKEREWQAQLARDKQRRDDLRAAYQAERRAIQSNKDMKPAERKAALSVASMGKVTDDIRLKREKDAEHAALKARYPTKPADQYRAYLAERAGNGDADALAELRRQRSPQRAPTGERIEHQTGQQPEAAPIMKPAAYKVDQQGNVTYYDQQKRAMFTDRGEAVEFGQQERDTIEQGLRLALAKFGPHIRLRGGSEEYNNMMADVAADKGLYVEFSDKALQDRYSQRREAAQAGRDYFTKSKGAQGGGQQPERDQPEQATQREREQQAQKPDHGRGR
ncbi:MULTISPECIES: LPD7 domain-containing protein [unclassified Acidovorax]|uniref:LPD7 domain-containing protein n=1 Tax=unclassified Acidovorax TaxID=2684926 RepID=UPI0028831A74|nr:MULTISPECIES: LPD7 domain-containing protein [unclassified Acidovorax]